MSLIKLHLLQYVIIGLHNYEFEICCAIIICKLLSKINEFIIIIKLLILKLYCTIKLEKKIENSYSTVQCLYKYCTVLYEFFKF